MATLQTIEAEIDRGIKALEGGDRGGAIDAFQDAFDGLEDVVDQRVRRDKHAFFGTLFINPDMPDRGLLAARAAVELDKALNDRNMLGQDILKCGTAIGRTGSPKGWAMRAPS